MTITTPPQETRVRSARRAADDAAPARAPQRRTPPPEEHDEAVKSPVRPAGSGATARPKQAKPPAKGRRRPAAKTTERPARRPAAHKPPARPAPRRSATPPRAPFVLLVVGLLGGALVSLLLLNTVLAQDAFTLTELQRGNQQLSERRQALQEDINRENSPAVLHAKARGLGMVDGQRPAFIDPRTGRVTEGGARPPGVSDEAMAAAAGAGVTGAPGAIMPPAGGATNNGGQGGGTR
jgi:hypothetical protein